MDSSAYFALADEDDSQHRPAVAIARGLATQRCRLVTTTFVVAETHALLVNRLSRRAGTTYLHEMERTSATVVRTTADDEARARSII